MTEKTYVVVFEVESNRPAHEVAANIRSALESRGLVPSGIDVNLRDGDSKKLRRDINAKLNAREAELAAKDGMQYYPAANGPVIS